MRLFELETECRFSEPFETFVNRYRNDERLKAIDRNISKLIAIQTPSHRFFKCGDNEWKYLNTDMNDILQSMYKYRNMYVAIVHPEIQKEIDAQEDYVKWTIKVNNL
jgi:hypothetical protein